MTRKELIKLPNTLDIEKEISAAEAQSSELGERFTAPRRMVFRKLLEAQKPIKAYDIIGIRDENDKPAKPPTIYRALEFLCRIGLVHKIESDSSYFACSHHHDCHSTSHLPLVMICQKCGNVFEDHIVAIENLIGETATKRGFKVAKMMLEAHGICKNCESTI